MVSTSIHGNEYTAEAAQYLQDCKSFSVTIEAKRGNGCQYFHEHTAVILFADDPMKFVELGQELKELGLHLCQKKQEKEKGDGAPQLEAV